MEKEIEKSNKTIPMILAVLGTLYGLSPIDFMPDIIPVAGWMDDLVVMGGSFLHIGQSFAQDTNQSLARLIGLVKWIVVILGGLLVAILGILGVSIYNIFN